MSTHEQTLNGWPVARVKTAFQSLTSRNTSHRTVLTGSVVMLLGSALVSLANFGYNISVAHLLGPGDFSHAAAAVTLLMLASCVNLAFQLVTAKFIARNESASGRAAVYQSLLRRAWLVGFVVCGAMVAGASALANYLRMPSPMLIIILGLGMLFYIPLGVRRGGMQGSCHFARLSANLTAEAVVKLVGAVLLIAFGVGVNGAVAAISLSVFVAFLLPAGDSELRGEAETVNAASFMEGMQAIIFFIGQVIISNIDILMVKHYFAPADAGLYAAVALVGRLLYFATWSVTSVMFPVSAGTHMDEERRSVIALPLLFVAALSIIFVLFLGAFPDLVIRTLFGSGFHRVGSGVEQLLTANAIATGVYAVCVVLITYEMSRRIANTGWFQLVVSLLIVVCVALFHNSLMQVVIVQQVLRGLLLLAVAIPFFGKARNLQKGAA